MREDEPQLTDQQMRKYAAGMKEIEETHGRREAAEYTSNTKGTMKEGKGRGRYMGRKMYSQINKKTRTRRATENRQNTHTKERQSRGDYSHTDKHKKGRSE